MHPVLPRHIVLRGGEKCLRRPRVRPVWGCTMIKHPLLITLAVILLVSAGGSGCSNQGQSISVSTLPASPPESVSERFQHAISNVRDSSPFAGVRVAPAGLRIDPDRRQPGRFGMYELSLEILVSAASISETDAAAQSVISAFTYWGSDAAEVTTTTGVPVRLVSLQRHPSGRSLHIQPGPVDRFRVRNTEPTTTLIVPTILFVDSIPTEDLRIRLRPDFLESHIRGGPTPPQTLHIDDAWYTFKLERIQLHWP